MCAMNCRTPERADLLRELWPSAVESREILRRINDLPGPPLHDKSLRWFASVLKLRRPIEAKRKAVKLAKRGTPAGTHHRVKKLLPTTASEAELQAMIADHIRQYGVTLCPPAAVERTTALIPIEAAMAISQHENARIEALQAKSKHLSMPRRNLALEKF